MSWRRHSLAFAVLIWPLAVRLARLRLRLQPLYGTTAGGSRHDRGHGRLSTSSPIPGRVGQKLRNELIFTTTGGGAEPPTRYRLDIVIKESVTNQLVHDHRRCHRRRSTRSTPPSQLVNVADGKVLIARQGDFAGAL